MQKLLALKINIEEKISIEPIRLYTHELDFECPPNRKFARVYHHDLQSGVDRIVFAPKEDETPPCDLELFTQDQECKMIDIRYPPNTKETLLKSVTRPSNVKWMARLLASKSGSKNVAQFKRVGVVQNQSQSKPPSFTNKPMAVVKPAERMINEDVIIPAEQHQESVSKPIATNYIQEFKPVSRPLTLPLGHVAIRSGVDETSRSSIRATQAKTKLLISNIFKRSCVGNQSPKLVYKVITRNSKGEQVSQTVRTFKKAPVGATSSKTLEEVRNLLTLNRNLVNGRNPGIVNTKRPSPPVIKVTTLPDPHTPADVPIQNPPLTGSLISESVAAPGTSKSNVEASSTGTALENSIQPRDRNGTYSPIVKLPPSISILRRPSTVTSTATQKSAPDISKSPLTMESTQKDSTNKVLHNSNIHKGIIRPYSPTVKLPPTIRIEQNKPIQTLKPSSTITSSVPTGPESVAKDTIGSTRKEEGINKNVGPIPNIQKDKIRSNSPIGKLPAPIRIEQNKSIQASNPASPMTTGQEPTPTDKKASTPSNKKDSAPSEKKHSSPSDNKDSATPQTKDSARKEKKTKKGSSEIEPAELKDSSTKRPKIRQDEDARKKRLSEKLKDKSVKTLVIKTKRSIAQTITTENSEPEPVKPFTLTGESSDVQPKKSRRKDKSTSNELKSSNSERTAASSKKKSSKRRKRTISSGSSDNDATFKPARKLDSDEAPIRMTRQRASFGDYLESTGRLAKSHTWTPMEKMKNVQVKLKKLTPEDVRTCQQSGFRLCR